MIKMVKAGGYANKLGWVNLTEKKIEYREIDENIAYKYIGGRGLGVKLVYDNGPGKDPFSPENILAILVGPLTGTLTPMSSRIVAVTRSPLTGTVTDSHAGGYIGPALKWAGFDGVVLSGKSDQPVYLIAKDGKITIEDASQIWGKDVFTMTSLLKQKHGEVAKVYGIGPAGENLCREANIMHDAGRASGRGGVGAVMGSKKVKALVVIGDEKAISKPANPDKFNEVRERVLKRIIESPVTSPGKGGLSVYGTSVLVNIVNELGAYPTRNAKDTQFEFAFYTSGENLRGTILRETPTCFGCPVHCKRHSEVSDGKYKHKSEGPEYETCWSLGAMIGVGHIEAVSYLNYLCNYYGLDTISVGCTLAMACEATERGLLKDGVRFGDVDGLADMIRKIALREGVGDILAEGTLRAAEKLGDKDLAMTVKSQGIPAYDPRGLRGFIIAYSTSNRGACHLRAYTTSSEILGIPYKTDPLAIEGKVDLVIMLQNLFSVTDSLNVCKFSTFAYKLEDYADLLSSVTGWDINPNELMKIGERIWNLERYYNQLCGFDRKDDKLPRRFYIEPAPSGPAKGWRVDEALFEKIIDEYYEKRGWTKDGKVPEAKLRELGII
ncbi:MAG: aldehyde ferredoxin oxidoreductase family protein [Nitrososphaerales archaeon]